MTPMKLYFAFNEDLIFIYAFFFQLKIGKSLNHLFQTLLLFLILTYCGNFIKLTLMLRV